MDDQFEYEMEVFLDPNAASAGADSDALDTNSGLQRLKNLGYGTGEPLDHQVRAFQRDCGLDESGDIADILDELNRRHDGCTPPLQIDPNG
ncbi:MAG TPA: hypothetical protein VFA65_23080 [Bryobacteraceae bacterium]|nr:hypothetical protein [Bryobacteraceae bacterium]